jgi:phage gpG-like protein
MTTFTLNVQDIGVQAALNGLVAKVSNPTPFLQALGDDIVERAKRRFETSTGPDGQPWKPNSAATLEALGERLVGHRNRKGERSYEFSRQGGILNAKGLARMNAKKPLIGDSQQLRQQIKALASSSDVSVTSSMAYSAIQQFGGKAGRGLKVTIPARPFLPVHADGTLYPEEQALIMAALNDWLTDGVA